MNPLPERVLLLIVEDESLIREDLRRTFLRPPSDWQAIEAAPKFEVDVAATGTEARRKLEASVDRGRPYDVMLLDLNLPETAGQRENPEVGMKILTGMSLAACHEVVVMSKFNEARTLQKLIQHKASDFVAKPFTDRNENLYRSVLDVLRHPENRRMQAEWSAYRQRRASQWLLVQSCNQVVDRMGEVVADALADVSARLRELTILIEKQGRLRGTVDDDLMQALERLTQSLRQIPRQYAAARSGIGSRPGGVETFVLEEKVQEVLGRLAYGLARKRLQVAAPTDGKTRIRTFKEVETLLEEIVYGAIETSSDEGVLRVVVDRAVPGFVDLVIDDTAAAVNPETLARTTGESAGSPLAERAYGLSLAQRLAHNVGASIEVRRLTKESGNRVTLRIPVLHDENCDGGG